MRNEIKSINPLKYALCSILVTQNFIMNNPKTSIVSWLNNSKLPYFKEQKKRIFLMVHTFY